ncbi:MAG TPA: preprotein translocase subunit YajC [Gemmatimonadaceae bacterium]|jgi:preprotein translocase subunit YajC
MSHLPAAALLALQAPPGGGMSLLLLQFGLIFAIFYFLVIRPQQRQRKQHDQRLRELKRGDEIVTAGGIIGEIVHIGPAPDAKAALEDRVTIKSGESRLVIERARIAKVLGAPAPASKA